MTRFSSLLYLVIVTIIYFGNTPTAFAQEESILDLSKWDASMEPVNLNGVWDLYWNELVTPEQIHNMNQEAFKVRVPSVWSRANTESPSLPNEGYGTYRVQILMSEDHTPPPLALYVGGVATSYRLWINGELYAENGTVGTSLQTMVPYNLPKAIPFVPEPGLNELVIQVSNFVQRKGGIWEPIQLGNAERIGKERMLNFASEIFVIGCLLTMGLYHLGLYAGRKKDRSALYFGGLCLAVG